jgi:hypothetical protein
MQLLTRFGLVELEAHVRSFTFRLLSLKRWPSVTLEDKSA